MSRVVDHTSDEANREIRTETQHRLEYYRRHPDEIDVRLAVLDTEWDVERMLETMSSSFTLLGFALALATRNRRWLIVPIVVQTFFLQHALQGWCPPLPVLRGLGFRTQAEIMRERYALASLRVAPVAAERAAPVS
jgi:hypothetical protein